MDFLSQNILPVWLVPGLGMKNTGYQVLFPLLLLYNKPLELNGM